MESILELKNDKTIRLVKCSSHDVNTGRSEVNAQTKLITDGKVVDEGSRIDRGIKSLFLDGENINPIDTLETKYVRLVDHSYAIRLFMVKGEDDRFQVAKVDVYLSDQTNMEILNRVKLLLLSMGVKPEKVINRR